MENNTNLPIAVTQVDLNPIERYKVLSASKKVREIAFNELENFCLKILIKAFFNSGSKPLPDNDMKILIQELYNDLAKDHAGVSIEDIGEAFRIGSKGQYGEFYGINPKAWNNWITTYLKNETRLLALKCIKPETKAESPEEIKKQQLEFIDIIIELYERPNPEHVLFIQVYNRLVSTGLLHDDVSDFKEESTEMLREVEEEKKTNKAPAHERIKEGSKEWQIDLIRTSKQLKVLVAFQKMKKAKFDLKKYLIEKL